jgi:hypothetical protein
MVGTAPSSTAPKPQAGPGAKIDTGPAPAPAAPAAAKKDARKNARKDVAATPAAKEALPGFSGDLNLDAPASSKKAQKKMRPVTWVLFGITVILGLVVAFVPLGERGRGTAPASAQQPPVPTEPEAPAPAAEPPSDTDMFASEEVAPGVASDTLADTLAGPHAPALLATTAPADQDGSSRRGRGRRGEQEPAVVQRPLERQAVDLLVAGHYGQALAHYEWLSAAHPDDRVYPHVVRILERRIRDRCLEHDMQGEECDMVME